MTMMEEIAEALREAAFYAEQYVRQGGGTKRKQVAAASFYLNLAAKTEQMRCDNCERTSVENGNLMCINTKSVATYGR